MNQSQVYKSKNRLQKPKLGGFKSRKLLEKQKELITKNSESRVDEMIKKAREEISRSKPPMPDSNKNNLSVMIPKNPRNLKLDIITENAKGNDSSSNSSKPTEVIDDRSRNLDESNLEDEIKGIPQEVDNL